MADSKMVPREPTAEMIDAGPDDLTSDEKRRAWQAMYDAAPAQAEPRDDHSLDYIADEYVALSPAVEDGLAREVLALADSLYGSLHNSNRDLLQRAAARIERQAQETARWIEHAKFQCQAKLDALRRVDVLQEALREQTVDRTGEYGRCVLCESLWRFKDTERHAPGCLASPAETIRAQGDDRG